MNAPFTQFLLLLAAAVAVVLTFQRLRIPPSLGYLLVGVLLGPHTIGPVVDTRPIEALAEFGIVFLLFTIGLNFSLAQIRALRSQVLTLGTGQVVITTLMVGCLAWLGGLDPAAAFVVGAVFAQSSTTIIARQLAESKEADERHGRLSVAMSVFQDVTAVPFLVVIPVLGLTADASQVGTELVWAVGKALLAFLLVFVAGRWLLRPLIHYVAEQRSAELFTLTVLLISLVAAGATGSLGLSMAFGAFLAGMMLGETEFRHQMESTIRPFRDVLLGLFFISVGALFDPSVLPRIWHWAVLGTFVLLTSKILIVRQIVRLYGLDNEIAWRVGLLLAVGGEFGFALLAIALGAGVIDNDTGQVALTSVLFSLVIAPFLIRFNGTIARRLAAGPSDSTTGVPGIEEVAAKGMFGHVIICGYGRVGQGVAHLLDRNGIPFVALDLDPARVKDAYTAGEQVYYADATERDILVAIGIDTARLVVISHGDVPGTLKILQHVRSTRSDLPVLVRTSDSSNDDELLSAGATLVIPEALEASLMIAAQALLLLNVPRARVRHELQEQRSNRYRLLREFFRGEAPEEDARSSDDAPRLHSIVVKEGSRWVGHTIGELPLGEGVTITALVRDQQRARAPSRDTVLVASDVLVLYATPAELAQSEAALI